MTSFRASAATMAVAAMAALESFSFAQIVEPGGEPNPAYPDFYAWFDAGDGVNGRGAPPDGSELTRWIDRTGNVRDLVRVSSQSAQRQNDLLRRTGPRAQT